MKCLKNLVAALSTASPTPPAPRERCKSQNPQRTCKNCKKTWVTHTDVECMDLEANTDKRWPNWKIILA